MSLSKYIFAAGKPRAPTMDLVDQRSFSDYVTANNILFENVSFGDEDSVRKIYVSVPYTANTAGDNPLSAVLVNGVAALEIASRTIAGKRSSYKLYVADAPSGKTGSIELQWSGAQSSIAGALACIYRGVGFQSAVDSQTSVSASSSTATLTTSAAATALTSCVLTAAWYENATAPTLIIFDDPQTIADYSQDVAITNLNTINTNTYVAAGSAGRVAQTSYQTRVTVSAQTASLVLHAISIPKA